MLNHRTDAQDDLLLSTFWLMRLPSTACELVAVVLEGLSSNWWGYRCPVYCVELNFSLIGLTFILGILCGVGLTFWVLRISIGVSPSHTRQESSRGPRGVSRLLSAKRSDLVFPADALGSQDYVLIKIEEPKTRGRAARHQSSRVEAADLVAVISIAFEGLPKASPLWPHAGQTLRKRFDQILHGLCIPTARRPLRSLDLGSLRPGGATYLLQITEDSEYVRRKGRWVSHKILEIYLQEVTACAYISDLPVDARSRVLCATQTFDTILQEAISGTKAKIPSRCGYQLWSHQV